VDQAICRKIGKVKSSKTPPEIQQLKYSRKNTFHNLLPEEDVIYFRRDFSINNKSLRKK